IIILLTGKKAAKHVTENFIKPINLEFEKIYFPYLLVNKKRYAGLYWTNTEKWDKLDSKGIETVRRDNCLLVQNVIETSLKKILIDRDIEGAETYVKNVISDLLQNKIDMSQLVITKALSKSGIVKYLGPFVNKMQYAPSDKATQEKTNKIARNLFSPHLIWINFLADRFQAFHYRSTELVQLYIRLFLKTLNASSTLSNHTLSLEGRLQILINGFKLIQSHQLEASTEYIFRRSLFGSAFNWFSLPP
ncbi:19652_t:CDS:2, partial [Entrophospora sp. SA101]